MRRRLYGTEAGLPPANCLTMSAQISIITPVYNVAPYLRQCLESVLDQSFPDWELICVDDGSSDGSADILADYARKDSRFRFLAQEHVGLSRARNKALSEAAGEYVAFLDGDDYLSPQALAQALPRLTGEVDYVCFGTNVFGRAPLACRWRESFFCNPVYSGRVEVDEAVIRGTNTHVWNKIYRRSIIDRHGLSFPDGLFYEDAFFTRAYLLVSGRGYYLPERLYHYRLRPDSVMGLSRKGDFERASDLLLVMMELFKFMKARGLLPGRETLLAGYLVESFHLSLQYAPAAAHEKIKALAGRFFEEIGAEAGFQNKAAVFQALLRDAEESRRKLDSLISAPWHRVGRKLGLVRLLKDV